jgi:hypothetical protein
MYFHPVSGHSFQVTEIMEIYSKYCPRFVSFFYTVNLLPFLKDNGMFVGESNVAACPPFQMFKCSIAFDFMPINNEPFEQGI